MKKRQAVLAADVPFRQVPWGLTKDLVGPERMGSEYIRIKITEYQPGFSHKMHVHPTQEEVIFVLEGRGISETQDDKIQIGPGSVVFCSCRCLSRHNQPEPNRTAPGGDRQVPAR